MSKLLGALVLLPHAFAACPAAHAAAPARPAAQEPSGTKLEAAACAFSERDTAWLERALEAWRFASQEITGIGPVSGVQATFFDAACGRTSGNALSSESVDQVLWSAAPHDGEVLLPDGTRIPAGVTSHASGDGDRAYFVMSTPSVWSAAGVGQGADLEATMIAVMLHEASHVAQQRCYGERLDALIERNGLPDSFNDDAVQDRFEEEGEFSASVQEETDLLLRAAAEIDDLEARLLAYEARERMRARAERWFVGDDAYLREAEDLWLTYEGAGQWTGYQWLVHPRGGGLSPDVVLPRFARDSYWSQREGFALFLALDRLVGPSWKDHAYGDGAKTALEMLDAALEQG